MIEHFNSASSSPFLFIGSGFSRRYLGLEDWGELLRKFCPDNHPYEYYFSKAEGSLAKVAELMSDDFFECWWATDKYSEEREKYKHFLLTHISTLKIAIASYIDKLVCEEHVNETYIDEINVLSKLDVDGIITTNWDQYLDKLFPDYKVYVGQRELFLSNPLLIGEIYKIHGCCSNPNSMILTDSDYKDFNSKNAYLAAKLITLFVEHPIVFIGYSIADENIQNIISSIVKCIKPEDVRKIRDNLIFIKRNNNSSVEEISNSFIQVDGSQIPIKVVTTNNFVPIYEAISETKRKIPVKYLRYFKEQFYTIIKENDPEKKLYALDYEKIEDIRDVEFVVGVGVISDIISLKGYSILTYEDLFSFYFYEEKYKNDSILEKTLPSLLSNTSYIPIYKFLRNEKITSKTEYENSKYNLERHLKNRLAVKPDKYKGGKSLSEQFNRYAKGKALEEIISEFSPEKALVYIPFIDWTSMDLQILEKFLKENFNLLNVTSQSANYKKLVCLYDYLKYGWD